MIIVKGKAYNTIADASEILGVSAKTIRDYIDKGIIPKPPEIMYGIRVLRHFPTEYIEQAKGYLDKHRNAKFEKKR